MVAVRLIVGALLATSIAAGPALACKGPNLQFSDDFSSLDVAWVGDGLSASAGKALLKSNPRQLAATFYQGSFFSNGDFCIDVTFPDVKDASAVVAGLSFLASDFNNFYAFVIRPDGNAGLFRRQNGGWLTPVSMRKADSIKTTPGSVNTLRVTVKGTSVALYVNDKPFVNTKVAPNPNGLIGLYVESDGNTFQFDNLNVTD